MDVIEAGDVVEKPSPNIFRLNKTFTEYETRIMNKIKHNFLDTVGYMEYRKFSRKHQGVFRNVARGWTLAILIIYSIFANVLFFATCPNSGRNFAINGLFYKGYNLVILCIELGLLSLTTFWLVATQFQTGVVYSFRLSIIFSAITLILFVLRVAIPGPNIPLIFQKCDYELKSGFVIIYNFIPLLYLLLQFFISICSFFYSRLKPLLASYYYKHPWFLKSWKFVSVEPVELRLLSFGKIDDSQLNQNVTSDELKNKGTEYQYLTENNGKSRLFWRLEGDDMPQTRLARGFYIEIKRFSIRKLMKRLDPIRLDLLLSFRTRKDTARRPYALEKPGCDVTSWYLGEINEEGRPHGFGRWREDDYHGEILVGFWKDGYPVGPFKTKECRSGSGFVCLRLGYCNTDSGPTPYTFGYADIECSVSGQFFRGFPLCHIYPAPTPHVNRSPSIFARIGAKGKAAFEDTTQKGKLVFRTLFNLKNIFKSMKSKMKLVLQKMPILKKNKLEEVEIENSRGKVVELQSNNKSDLSNVKTFSLKIPEDTGDKQNSINNETYLNETPHHRSSLPIDLNLSLNRGVRIIKRVKEKLRRKHNLQEKERDIAILWLFQNLSPHLPMFTIHPKNEVTILVDGERGLYIAGYFPISEVLQYTKHAGIEFPLDINDGTESYEGEHISHLLQSTNRNKLENNNQQEYTSSSTIGTLYHSEKRKNNRYLESVEVRVVERSRYNLTDNSNRRDFQDLDDSIGGILYYPELEIKNWVHSDGLHAVEVLIFIHGYNNTLTDALRQVGQMIAFGNFPSYIKPLVFSWPAGNSFLEYFKARKSSDSPVTHKSFCELITGLRNRGIRHIHVMTHSMGTRLFIKCFPKLLSANLIETCEQDRRIQGIEAKFPELYRPNILNSNSIECEKVQIVSMTFLNPDVYLDDFISKVFPILRKYCNLITMYGDSQDGALKWSEIIHGRKALGCNVFGLHYGVASFKDRSNQSNISIYDLQNKSDHILSAEASVQPETKLNKVNRQESTLSLIYPSRLLSGKFPAKTFSPQNSNSGIFNASGSSGKIEAHKEVNFQYLDMDVIDQSYIDQNVSTMRHNNWNLNREVIEDLRELVVTRKRAYQRSTRLDKREGNVWVYRLAPSYVTSIFD
ncbi:uncharacterized protein CMU_038120 [Cryptosporidium muris RN66]|uniref:Uncharacterized protein n=1 Tax=Cryptosporidium muris (strain RN66) TaxID=441375 RepID=B6A955_CRYMR|nr:uncharacterized protein CMU_038120 [Cryptosporidium muris RN66]EEA04746.1 hypothetical protein, conserved [Cryptosporidium muris RN66]|eukprot:XP_002139095.1 hypothetical protein [Cryptosporidium muris RN66]